MTKTATVDAAKPGVTFEMKAHPADMVKMRRYTVAEKCEQNAGQWICITHKQVFRNQFMKDSHIFTGRHLLAWICFEHGVETP